MRNKTFLVFFFLIFSRLVSAQNDSDKIKIGPEELQVTRGGHYFNFSDKNKVNIEVTVLGGLAAGKYLIPQGTTLFDLLIMSGGTNSYSLEDVKIVRFASETPKLKSNEVLEFDFADLYGGKEDILRKTVSNPIMKPGDMVIVPEPKPTQSVFYYINQTITFVGTLISFYYLIDNLIYRSSHR